MERHQPDPKPDRQREGASGVSMPRYEEQATVGIETEERGAMRVRKHVETEPAERQVPRWVEQAETERRGPNDSDSGEIETLPDGSISIPILEEELVVTKRVVVKERIVVRKHTQTVEETVAMDLRRERVEITSDPDVQVESEGSSA